MCPAGPEMEATEERVAHLEAQLARLRQDLQKVKEQDAGTEHTAGPTTTKRKNLPTHIAPPPKRTRVDDSSSLRINGKLKHFRSGRACFPDMLMQNDRAYFDRTRYIQVLEDMDDCILFCRPRRFGKSLTISMLEHFHGLQYADEHQTLYQGLDVQKDIDENKCKPGQYFVLKFDFSPINASLDLAMANENLIASLNFAVEEFYETYATYLGEDVASLCRNIDSKRPSISLEKCSRLVRLTLSRTREQENELAGVQGIYLLVDEYDAFANNYLDTAEPSKIHWDNTAAGRTFRSFWSMAKSLTSERFGIQRAFVTGISPLSISGVGSGFNVASNLSFHEDLAGLCGLTFSDLKETLKEIYKNDKDDKDDKADKVDKVDKHLSEMTKAFNGYHFCMYKTVETVYNSETCLAYLHCIVNGGKLETQNPQNSEVAEQFLERAATSVPVIADLEKALECDENGNFVPLKYGEFKQEFGLQHLSGNGSKSCWRSLLVYFGALTFHRENPETHLKIPNKVAANRIARAVLERYKLSGSLAVALQMLVQHGDIERALSCYRELMTQRDVTIEDLTKTDEGKHRDSFYFSFLRYHYLLLRAELKVTKLYNTKGRIDLLIPGPKQLIVTEWKFLRIQYLDVRGPGNATPPALAKASILNDYKLSEILRLQFIERGQFHKKSIQEWAVGDPAVQLRNYIKSREVTQLVKNQELGMRAHLVIIVGSRHILLWDMDKEGNLANEPCLVGMTST